jgi:MFS family permease
MAGQAVSLLGTWMQTVAIGWLVLQLTGSGTALGMVVAAQFLPILLLGPYGGLIADRVDKRRLLMATQAVLAAAAAALGVLVVTGAVELWMVVLIAVVLGLVGACDKPARQAFALEMVGPERLRNAVSLHSVLVNVARAGGPAVAGLIIATAGTGICFLINAASYAAVLAALWTMDTEGLRPTPPARRTPGQVREGLRYVGRTPGLLVPLVMVALIGTFAYEFQVVLPLMATGPFQGDAATYGVLTSAMGAGAIGGGLIVARHGRTGLRPLTIAAAALGVAILAVAASPSLPVAVLALAVTGAASITFLATGSTSLQLDSEPGFRGRVMALWTVAFLGSTPIGAPVVGAICEHAGPRAGLATGAAACMAAAAVGALALARASRRAEAGSATREAQPAGHG